MSSIKINKDFFKHSLEVSKNLALKVSIPANCEMSETTLNKVYCPHCNSSNQDLSTIQHAAGNHTFRCCTCEMLIGVFVNKVTYYTPYKIPKPNFKK